MPGTQRWGGSGIQADLHYQLGVLLSELHSVPFLQQELKRLQQLVMHDVRENSPEVTAVRIIAFLAAHALHKVEDKVDMVALVGATQVLAVVAARTCKAMADGQSAISPQRQVPYWQHPAAFRGLDSVLAVHVPQTLPACALCIP